MATITTYHVGGLDAAAPQQNRASLADSGSGLYTAWDTSGAEVEARPLTTEESAELDALALATAAHVNRDALREKAKQALGQNANYLGHAAIPPGAALTTAQLTTIVRLLVPQVDALTRQTNILIRQTLNLLEDIGDTEGGS